MLQCYIDELCAKIIHVTQTITLVAHNTRRNFFERAALSDLIECTYDKDVYYLYQMDYVRDLRNPQEYKIMSDNGTYVICKVNIVPEGGAWSDGQESINNPYKLTVATGPSGKGFTDFGEGWIYALEQSQTQPVTIKLFEDWIAPGGKFEYSNGTDGGRHYVSGDNDITIDLNGNNINRGLTSATNNGEVFRIESGAKLTITDNSDRGDGKITGGYNNGDGGAFYIDYGKLYINGGEITGNKATGDGGAIYGTNEDDTFVYINGGKIYNNTAAENGGAIFMYNGYLYVDGGEISGNYATENGGGIYWESRDILCLTGGKVINNYANMGAGVYATDWGDIYLGGTAVVKDNITIENIIYRDFFLEDTDVVINNAAGQNADVPNKPLTDGAQIVIDPKKSGYCISDSDSRFTMESIQYLSSGNGVCVVGAIYDENGGNNKYKIYSFYNSGTFAPPRVESVTSGSDIISQVSVDNNSHVITLRADMKARKSSELKNVKLNALIDATFNKEGVRIVGIDIYRDFTEPQKFMIMDTENAYTPYTVKVEWVCEQHEDADGNSICDYCDEYTLTDFEILAYNEETKEATVFVPEAGIYSLIFADYENKQLNNTDIVDYTFKAGVNVVPQADKAFVLASGDKVMLWYDMINLVPVCEVLTVK